MGKNIVLKFNERATNKFKQPRNLPRDVLWGVVALVDVGSESRALVLKAELESLSATVVTAWSPIVTHLIWTQGGSRNTRAQALALACHVVSPLWVKACTATLTRVPEQSFRAVTRDSDLPSPATLRVLLETAEKENWDPSRLLCDKENSSEGRLPRLRISNDSDGNTTSKTCRRDTTHESIDAASRINTAPRRALPASLSPFPIEPKSRRKLFTVRADMEKDDSDKQNTPAPCVTKQNPCPVATTNSKEAHPRKVPPHGDRVPERQKKSKKYNLTQEKNKNLKQAQIIAKQLASVQTPKRRIKNTQTQRPRHGNVPRIVLSGMPKSQKQAVVLAIKALSGKIQKYVDYQTTHVLLGLCKEDSTQVNAEVVKDNGQNGNEVVTNQNMLEKNNCNKRKHLTSHNKCTSSEPELTTENENVEVAGQSSQVNMECENDANITCSSVNNANEDRNVGTKDKRQNHNSSDMCNGIVNDKSLRTVKTLLGAVRGCRVLHAQWALESQKAKKWLPRYGYEVTYLLRVSQAARIERSAFGKMHKEYVYKIFHGRRVFVSEAAEKRDAAIELLTVCGAQIVSDDENTQGCRTTQNNQTHCSGIIQSTIDRTGRTMEDCDLIRIGADPDEVNSKWVFDSVLAGRPKTTRKYINRIFAV